MSALLCCRRRDMGAALAPAPPPTQPPTMAELMRERKKKSGGAALGTLRRRITAARRRDQRPDRECEHARYIRSIVSPWRLGDVVALCGALEAGAALRDLHTQASLARAPAPSLGAELSGLLGGATCDVTLLGAGWALPAHRAILAARSPYFRELLSHCTSRRVPLAGAPQQSSPELLRAALHTLYGGAAPSCELCQSAAQPAHNWDRDTNSDGEPEPIDADTTNTWGGRGGCSCARRGAAARRLAAALGCATHALHRDIQYLLESGEYSDCRLSWGCGRVWAAHRAILAARSRLLRKAVCVLGSGSGALRVDEAVLPRRFAGVLLHAAYTDQVELSLVEPKRAATQPRRNAAPQLEDAFQLYEIARFVEMPILAQGCEDAIAALLSPTTLPRVLRWSSAPHASQWVHRQAMRYLLDEFPTLCGVGHEALPRSALTEALRSPFLQCSEPQALKALQRWSEQDVEQAEGASGSRGGGGGVRRGRRRCGEAAWRGAAGLVALLRLEHIPPDDVYLTVAIRRGLPAPPPVPKPSAAWLGRPPHRPPRAFLPYLDELKALLAEQPIPPEELAHARRMCCVQRAPDTLYMLQGSGSGVGGEALCVSPRTRRALRMRQSELRAAAPAATALALPHTDPQAVHTQIALRCVRELDLPDACADILLAEEPADQWLGDECGASTSRQARAAPRRAVTHTGSLGRRSASPGGCCDARLSAAVPDVAMPPAGTPLHQHNVHNFTGAVLQLDLGDGATHTPRPGSRRATPAAGASVVAGVARRRTADVAAVRVWRP